MSSVRHTGTIVKWDDEKGFGFIAPDRGNGDVFAHVKAVVGSRRPVAGDRVYYFPGKDAKGRSRAVQVQLCGSAGVMPSAIVLPLIFAAAFLAALVLLAAMGKITAVFPVVYVMMSAVTLAAYRHDKTCAQHKTSRLPENGLHLLEFFGGWPGALAAQQWFHHKNRKLSYQVVFWLIVAAHFGAWIYLAAGK